MSQHFHPRFSSVALTLGAFALGCGGRTELDNRPILRSGSPKPNPPAAATPTPAKPGQTGTGGGMTGTSIGTSNDLGECMLGPAPGAGQACKYMADNRCYPTPVKACACICPRNLGDTTCAEAFFPNPDGSLNVNCFVL